MSDEQEANLTGEETAIRDQMKNTLESLSEKLETVEQEVTQTVHGAAEAVNQTVDTIKETVSAVRETVEDSVSAVKDTVEGSFSAVKQTMTESYATVKDWMDVRAHVENHPLFCMACSIATGYCIASMFERSPMTTVMAQAAEQPRPAGGNGHHRAPRESRASNEKRGRESVLSSLFAQFQPELNELKGLALGTLLGTAREALASAMPNEIGQKIGEIIDQVTTKLGGKPLKQTELPGNGWLERAQENSSPEGKPGKAGTTRVGGSRYQSSDPDTKRF